jgi:hypothetical protein
VFTPGYDTATGYGILDVAAALAAPTPLRDSAEPNDDAASAATLTARTSPSGRTSGRVAAYEDPRDVLRVWLPAKKRLVVSSTSTSGVNLALYQGGDISVNRLATSTRTGVTTALSYANHKAGRAAYLVVTPMRGVRSSEYTTSLSAR